VIRISCRARVDTEYVTLTYCAVTVPDGVVAWDRYVCGVGIIFEKTLMDYVPLVERHITRIHTHFRQLIGASTYRFLVFKRCVLTPSILELLRRIKNADKKKKPKRKQI
jgi:hypothetical protein